MFYNVARLRLDIEDNASVTETLLTLEDNKRVTETLLKAGGLVNARDNDNQTSLQLAVKDPLNLDSIKLFLQAGTNKIMDRFP